MTIDEALNILQNEVRVAEVNDRPLEVSALQLGIEALHRIKGQRGLRCPDVNYPLPGETEE